MDDKKKIKDFNKEGKITVRVDRNICIGAAACVVIAPEVFQLDEEGKVFIVDANSRDAQTIIDAAKSCPVAAITIEDENGNKIWPT